MKIEITRLELFEATKDTIRLYLDSFINCCINFIEQKYSILLNNSNSFSEIREKIRIFQVQLVAKYRKYHRMTDRMMKNEITWLKEQLINSEFDQTSIQVMKDSDCPTTSKNASNAGK